MDTKELNGQWRANIERSLVLQENAEFLRNNELGSNELRSFLEGMRLRFCLQDADQARVTFLYHNELGKFWYQGDAIVEYSTKKNFQIQFKELR